MHAPPIKPFKIVLTMVVVFAATLAIMRFQQESEQQQQQPGQRHPLPAPPRPSHEIAAELPSAGGVKEVAAAQPESSKFTERPVQSDAPIPETEPSVDVSQVDVPAVVLITNTPGQERKVMLLPLSGGTLNVSLTLRSESGSESMADVTLANNRRQDLSALGLYPQRGDQIILHSPPYHDRVIPAR